MNNEKITTEEQLTPEERKRFDDFIAQAQERGESKVDELRNLDSALKPYAYVATERAVSMIRDASNEIRAAKNELVLKFPKYDRESNDPEVVAYKKIVNLLDAAMRLIAYAQTGIGEDYGFNAGFSEMRSMNEIGADVAMGTDHDFYERKFAEFMAGKDNAENNAG